ncbi:MAG: FtsK/SpoIIIE domain-containing protein [Planctomycetota bacterium]
MSVSPPEESRSRIGMPETAERILSLGNELAAASRAMAEGATAREAARADEDASYLSDERRLQETTDLEQKDADSAWRRRQKRLEEIRERRDARLARAVGTVRERLTAEQEERERASRDELDRIEERLEAETAGKRRPLEQRVRRWEELLPVVREHSRETERTLRDFTSDHGVDVGSTEPWSGEVASSVAPDAMMEEAERAFQDVLDEAGRATGWWGNSFARFGPLVFYHVLILAVGAGGALLLYKMETELIHVGATAGGAVVLLGLLQLARRSMRRRYEIRARDLFRTARQTTQCFEQHADAALKHLDALHVTLAGERDSKLRSEESGIRQTLANALRPVRDRLAALDRRADRAQKHLNSRHELRLDALHAEQSGARGQRHEGHNSTLADRTREHEERIAALDVEGSEEERHFTVRGQDALATFDRFAEQARSAVDELHRPWDAVDPEKLALPPAYPDFVPFGQLDLDLPRLAGAPGDATRRVLPATLTFPEYGSLLVRHGGGERDPAQDILMNAVLRVLTSFPAGKVRLTIVDPVGLGQSFSALMHLADRDEALVNGRIWTEASHIQQRLADLTQHIEKVIQNDLRDRFHSIGDYNAVAGELQEPYHFLVIADFPVAFNEHAADSLASIVSSGPRCGVYTLIAQDTRQDLPRQVDLDRLRRNGPVLTAGDGGFSVEGPAFESVDFVAEDPPEPEAASRLLDRIGKLSVDADRVEVPFTAVIPTADEMWSGRTDKGVRVPIGRTGAERLQYLDLGRGTAQHALIAGRTGSGKSTLFHVMITNMALWFSPDEVEFYLIDFKKGVEFKPFATWKTPHARVVAIESDREFGLSVLKAVDAELARRGDLFRREGVQDLAGFRKCGAPEVLPRTLVMIDEFQEFFTEDDAVARDAALLLDRFVRQGRAFGIHMVLGSQTLSGIYTLARSTLGQMGVRISLQCDEADSYLILSEDNGVARLLSRPGEAIYNDMSGMVEGNSPFQVVWLPDDEEAKLLKAVVERDPVADRETVVFEGNLPADLTLNPELLALRRGESAIRDGDDRVWLGDPNAIKGPTEVRFLPASGSNLLVVGQRRDAAFAMMTSSILSLAARRTPDEVRFVILDGGGHEPEFAARFEELAESVPHRVDRYDLRTAPDAVEKIARGIDAGGGPKTYLFAFGLQRLRILKKADEYSMSFSADEPESPGDRFDTILTEGPPNGVHTFVWCDTLTNLLRVIDRRRLREFDVRILFQMSAADSSELIDSSAGNTLGLHNALLVMESQGTFEKFRPYFIPEAAVMKDLGGG